MLNTETMPIQELRDLFELKLLPIFKHSIE